MPIRLIGFFRMGHASGWGTRAGAYAGGDAPTSDEHVVAADPESEQMHRELEDAAPLEPVDELFHEIAEDRDAGSGGGAVGTAVAAQTRVARRLAVAQTPEPTRPPRRRLNPKAAWPYVIGAAIIALEVWIIV
ncbi:MAG: glycosyl transferase family 2, partial [Microbacterium sp.]